MNTFALFIAEALGKNGVEVIEHAGKIWINNNNNNNNNKIENIANISDKTQYYSSEFKKVRREIQNCETISSVKTHTNIFRMGLELINTIKYCVNKHHWV